MTLPTQPASENGFSHVKPAGYFTRQVMNRAVAALSRVGISLFGSRVLWIRGRKSGQWRSTPVNPLTLGTNRYLVAPRGHVQWTKNLKALGAGELRIGRRVEPFTAVEVTDADKPEILRAYLKKWAFEVGMFFDGVNADSSEGDLARIAPRHPIFRIIAAEP